MGRREPLQLQRVEQIMDDLCHDFRNGMVGIEAELKRMVKALRKAKEDLEGCGNHGDN